MRTDTKLQIRADSIRDLRTERRDSCGEQRTARALPLRASRKTLEEGAWELGRGDLELWRWVQAMGAGNGKQAEAKARAKAPEDWKCKSRHKVIWVVVFIWKVPLEEEQEKVNLGTWGGTQPEDLEFGLKPVAQQ